MNKLILIIGLFFYCELSAQLKDSIVRKYFVCEKKYNKIYRIIVNGEKIWVKATSGKKLRGKLTILSDTVLEVHNLVNDNRDTFHTNSIALVKKAQ